MPTYNKEAYIKEALDSILMQKTSYFYQIIIADDCSTDKSIEIAEEYVKKNKNIFLWKSEKNQGLYENILRVYNNLNTNYFCVLDPDDYWIDKYKIQKALDFLEKNKEYSIYSANIRLEKMGNNIGIAHSNIVENKTFDFNDCLKGIAILPFTTSSIFRNIAFKNTINKMKQIPYNTQKRAFRGDTFRDVIHLHEGKLMFVSEIDSVYRITEEGIWQSLDHFSRKFMHCEFWYAMWLLYDKAYIEFLYFSYRDYLKLISTPLKNFLQISDYISVTGKIKTMQKDYESKNTILMQYSDNFTPKIKWKYKILLKIYEKIQRKLNKKGLI